jgi:hypothetical protein
VDPRLQKSAVARVDVGSDSALLNPFRRKRPGAPTWRQWYAIPTRETTAPEWIEWLRKQKGGVEAEFFLRPDAPWWIFTGILPGGEGLQPTLSECLGVASIRTSYRPPRDQAKSVQLYLGILAMVLSSSQRAVDIVANVHAQRYYVASEEWFQKAKTFELSDHYAVQSVASGGGCLWLHTHGLVQFGLPEVEVHAVPEHLAVQASGFLHTVARWMMEGESLGDEHTIGLPDHPDVWAIAESIRAEDNEGHGEPEYPLLRFSDFDPHAKQKGVGLTRYLSVRSCEEPGRAG